MLHQLSSVILSLKYWPGFRCQHKLLLAFIFFLKPGFTDFPLTIKPGGPRSIKVSSTLKHPSHVDRL